MRKTCDTEAEETSTTTGYTAATATTKHVLKHTIAASDTVNAGRCLHRKGFIPGSWDGAGPVGGKVLRTVRLPSASEGVGVGYITV